MSHEVMCIGDCEVGDKMVDIEGYKCARQRGTTPSRNKKLGVPCVMSTQSFKNMVYFLSLACDFTCLASFVVGNQ